MSSFVKNSRFVYVIGLASKPCSFVVGSFFHLGTLLLIAQAQCLSVGGSWRAGRMTSFFKKSCFGKEVYRFLRGCRKGSLKSVVLIVVLIAYVQHGVQR